MAHRARDLISAAVVDCDHKGHARVCRRLVFQAVNTLDDIAVKARAVADHFDSYIIFLGNL